MSYKRTAALLLTLTLAGSALAGGARAIKSKIRMGSEFAPIVLDPEGGISKMQMDLFVTSACENCPTATVTFQGENGLEFVSPTEWTFDVQSDTTHTLSIEFIIPPKGVGNFSYELRAGEYSRGMRIYFDAISDSVWWGNRQPGADPWHEERDFKKRMAAIDPEILEQKVEIIVDLRGHVGVERDTVHALLGSSMIPTDIPQVYRVVVTRRMAGYLDYLHIFIYDPSLLFPPQPTPPPQRDSDSASQPRSVPESKSQSDSSKSVGQVYLDHVNGLSTGGQLPAGGYASFIIRLHNDTWQYMAGISNGFRVYSPDGATWSSTVGDTLGTLAWHSSFDLGFWISHYSPTGSVADTVGFAGAKFTSGTGLPYSYNDTAYSITIGPITATGAGKNICIDSCWYRPENRWIWTIDSYTSTFPTWDGPHCYTIGGGEVDIIGTLYYVDSTPGGGPTPIRNALVRAYDHDVSPPHDYLGQDETGSDGRFYMWDIDNTDADETGSQDIYLRVWATNLAANVVQTLDSIRYECNTPVDYDVPSGNYVVSRTLDTMSGAFFIADVLLDGYDKWNSLRSGDNPGDSAIVIFATFADDVSLGYLPTEDWILVNDSSNGTDVWCEAYERSGLLHEYGHRICHRLGFLTAGDHGHHLTDSTSLEAAAGEGFASFYAALVDNSPIDVDYRGPFTDSTWVNWETGEFGGNTSTWGTVNTLGPHNQGAVAGVFWDICDQEATLDDFSGLIDWGDTTLPHHPDGRGDNLHDGPDNILKVLLDRQVDGHKPKTLTEFWRGWFDKPDFGSCPQMTDVWFEHGDSSMPMPKGGCCCLTRGDVNHDGTQPDIGDLVWLVNFMFNGGPQPGCMEEADINADLGGPDIDDLVYLVDYMFNDGPAIPDCDG